MHEEYIEYILSKSPKILLKYDMYVNPTASATFVLTLIMTSICFTISGSIS